VYEGSVSPGHGHKEGERPHRYTHDNFLVFSSISFPGKSEVEQWSDMYTVTSQLLLKVGREDDGVPVICLVDHPAVKDLQTQRYLEVMCE